MASLTSRCAAIGTAVILTAAVAAALKHSHKLAGTLPRVDLEAMIPARLGDWHAVAEIAPVQPDPATLAKVEQAYDQVLGRTYADRQGRRVMLSIAYGGDQSSDRLQAHRPEYCYAAQGFHVRRLGDESLPTGAGTLPVRRLVAQQAARREPITYWITVGDRAALPGLDRKLAQLRFGLTGTIPDGMLVRVSSLDTDTPAAHALQDRFIGALLASLAPEHKARFLGGT
jgi:EpsI family protein